MASKEDNNDTEFDYADEFFTKSPQDTVESEDTNAIDQTENPTGNAPTEVNDGVNQIKPGNELPELSNLEDTAMKSTHKNQASMNDITLEPYQNSIIFCDKFEKISEKNVFLKKLYCFKNV